MGLQGLTNSYPQLTLERLFFWTGAWLSGKRLYGLENYLIVGLMSLKKAWFDKQGLLAYKMTGFNRETFLPSLHPDEWFLLRFKWILKRLRARKRGSCFTRSQNKNHNLRLLVGSWTALLFYLYDGGKTFMLFRLINSWGRSWNGIKATKLAGWPSFYITGWSIWFEVKSKYQDIPSRYKTSCFKTGLRKGPS